MGKVSKGRHMIVSESGQMITCIIIVTSASQSTFSLHLLLLGYFYCSFNTIPIDIELSYCTKSVYSPVTCHKPLQNGELSHLSLVT